MLITLMCKLFGHSQRELDDSSKTVCHRCGEVLCEHDWKLFSESHIETSKEVAEARAILRDQHDIYDCGEQYRLVGLAQGPDEELTIFGMRCQKCGLEKDVTETRKTLPYE